VAASAGLGATKQKTQKAATRPHQILFIVISSCFELIHKECGTNRLLPLSADVGVLYPVALAASCMLTEVIYTSRPQLF
jgi:hypothetical protein